MPSGFPRRAILHHWRPWMIAPMALLDPGPAWLIGPLSHRDLVLPRLSPARSQPRSMLRNSCLLDDLAPPGCIRGHPIAHFFRRAPARLQAEPEHPVAGVGRRQGSSDLGAELGDDFGGNALRHSRPPPAWCRLSPPPRFPWGRHVFCQTAVRLL